MIRNLLFDMGGVIFRQNTEEAFRRFRQAGIDPDQYMGAFGQQGFFLDIETGAIDEAEFCRQMARAAERPSVSLDEARHCWLGFLLDVPVDRLRHLLTLRPHYHLGLLSNTNPFMMGFTRSPQFSADGRPISDYFDSLFCSYEMKAYKPDPAIFLQALAADGMQADETLFIDDSLKNIQAAEAVGIHGLHVPTNEDWRPALSARLTHNGGRG